MPRLPRIDPPGIPRHLVQRGNNRQACFCSDSDRVLYLGILREELTRHGCDLHAYVLMSNHVHLLLTPGAAGQVGRMMQSLGRRYVRHFNDRHRRTGTLWEGRYHACLVDSDEYFLSCSRYIELNPVRAGMVTRPADYPWSSYGANALGVADPLVAVHASYLALGSAAFQRQCVYRAIVDESPDPSELDVIREKLRCQTVLGSDAFKKTVSHLAGRRIEPGAPGRPKKTGLPKT